MTNQNYPTKSIRKRNQRISLLRQRMIEDMQLSGLSPNTQDRCAPRRLVDNTNMFML